MQRLNFPPAQFRFKNSENKTLIFDPIRKKFIVLTPEEWVRQHVIALLQTHYQIPTTLISVERQLKINQLIKRFDLVVFNKNGSIFLLVECKAPEIPIKQDTFDQIARYNLHVQAQHLFVTNGLEHYFCKLDYERERFELIPDLPAFGS
ncbi:type I restriction enzyme HsdR N-terminal domain-containing protein [Flavobacterium aurantiibacter]|uniref:Restriction endonuclease subunit R n=1 Tax=Flavobacterium aurantiibacter TaxID=2023067 RepID=A0A255ZTY3_9FLAO|nr:type I restriction enzyme HsdR N-terminal domain-containing protein [Flavobacterium aurantiibacter]OYQ44862.1 restriction endonuclease subunit R [Flavobacterium aurantiibacter]